MNVIKENFSKNDLFKQNERCDGKFWFIYATGNINFVSFWIITFFLFKMDEKQYSAGRPYLSATTVLLKSQNSSNWNYNFMGTVINVTRSFGVMNLDQYLMSFYGPTEFSRSRF
jgi:hypothetical protein